MTVCSFGAAKYGGGLGSMSAFGVEVSGEGGGGSRLRFRWSLGVA